MELFHSIINCIYEDPYFSDISKNDYNLQYCSPAINSGTLDNITADLVTNNDISGLERIIFNTIDIEL